MPADPSPADCAALCDRLSLRLDALLAQLQALPPLDPAAADRLAAEAEQALASWAPPPGWHW